MYFNQSESIRLDSQLRGWFRVDPTAKNGSVFDGDFRAYIGDEPSAARDISVSREQIFQRKDDTHAQW